MASNKPQECEYLFRIALELFATLLARRPDRLSDIARQLVVDDRGVESLDQHPAVSPHDRGCEALFQLVLEILADVKRPQPRKRNVAESRDQVTVQDRTL